MYCVFWPAIAYLRMRSHGPTRSKTFKNHEKVPFSSCTREAHARLTKKNKGKQKKVCWSAIGSDSQKLIDTQTLVENLEFCCFLLFFVVFCSFFYMHLLCDYGQSGQILKVKNWRTKCYKHIFSNTFFWFKIVYFKLKKTLQ